MLWLQYLPVQIGGWLLGMILVPIASLAGAWYERPSQIPNYKSDNILAWKWKFMWPWGNEEDGVTGAKWYRDLHSDWSPVKQAIMWSAFRNPFNNMRFVKGLNPVITPTMIQSVSGDSWDYTWQGVFSGFRWFPQFKGNTYRFWLGWKLKPEDRFGLADTDFRKYGVGFAVQFKKVS